MTDNEPHTPSEAYRMGRCPVCMGTGITYQVLRGEEGPCTRCDGSGDLETMLRKLSGEAGLN